MSAPATVEDEKIVPLFMSFEDFARQREEVYAEWYAEWQAAGNLWKATHAAIDSDNTALAKFDAPEVALAKADASRLLTKNRNHVASAKIDATFALHETLQAITIKRNDRLYGLGEVAKRSARFASAQRRPLGASATILSHPGSNR